MKFTQCQEARDWSISLYFFQFGLSSVTKSKTVFHVGDSLSKGSRTI